MKRISICISVLIFLTLPLAFAQTSVTPDSQVLWLDGYRQGAPFSCGYTHVYSNTGVSYWLDAEGNRLKIDANLSAYSSFSNGLAPVKRISGLFSSESVGWIGTDGNLKIPLRYGRHEGFSRNTLFATIDANNRLVTLDTTGAVMATAPAGMTLSPNWSSGLTTVEVKDSTGKTYIGFADRLWDMVIPARYEQVYSGFSGGGAIVTDYKMSPTGEHYYYAINVAGDKIGSPVAYPSVKPETFAWFAGGFGCGLLPVHGEANRWGVIDTHGDLVIPYQYDEVFHFSAGYALARRDELWDIIDTDGNVMASELSIDIYNSNRDYNFSEGLATVMQNGKWGYMDSTGQMVIPCQFRAAAPFSEGLAWVQREDGTWGILKSPLAAKSPWAEEEIQSAYVHDIITERTSSRFQEPMTRLQCAELTVNLAEMLKGRPIMEAEGTRFTDTRDWMALKAAQSAIATGVGDGSTFSPKSSVTREQFAAMLCRALQYGGTALPDSSLKSFTDSTSVSPWAVNAVAALTEAGIMQGTPDGLLLPQGQITVEEGLVLTLRAYQLDDISAPFATTQSYEMRG